MSRHTPNPAPLLSSRIQLKVCLVDAKQQLRELSETVNRRITDITLATDKGQKDKQRTDQQNTTQKTRATKIPLKPESKVRCPTRANIPCLHSDTRRVTLVNIL